MNTKRLLITIIALFVFIFAFEWVFHGIILKDCYAQTQNLWRPENEMMGYFHWLVLGQAVIAIAFAILFAQGFAAGGVGAGIRLGIMVALLRVGLDLITYAVQPLPAKLILFWAVGGLVETGLAGAIAGAIYKPSPPTSAPTQQKPA